MHHELNLEPVDLTDIKDTGPVEGHGPHVETWSGQAIYPLRPRVEDIRVADIVQGSAITNRYNGHTDFPISLAQHSVLVCRLIEEHFGGGLDMQRWGLLHDAAEVYVGDMVRPLKLVSPRFSNIEDLNFAAIAERFKLPPLDDGMRKMLKDADDYALMLEVAGAKHKATSWGPRLDEIYEWAERAPLRYKVMEADWWYHRDEFAARFMALWPDDKEVAEVIAKILSRRLCSAKDLVGGRNA